MRYGLIGDFHHKGSRFVETILDKLSIDHVVCTSDFDTNHAIREFIDATKGINQTSVPGNHDYASLFNPEGQRFIMYRPELVPQEHFIPIEKDPVAHEYLKKLFNPSAFVDSNHGKRIYLDSDNFGQTFKTLVLHGGLYSELAVLETEEIHDLWRYLRTEKDYRETFNLMREKGYRIMIRGHDHVQKLGVMNQTDKCSTVTDVSGKNYLLDPNNFYIINPGALYKGQFAVISTDADKARIHFAKLKS